MRNARAEAKIIIASETAKYNQKSCLPGRYNSFILKRQQPYAEGMNIIPSGAKVCIPLDFVKDLLFPSISASPVMNERSASTLFFYAFN
jgi:hypothetical protein